MKFTNKDIFEKILEPMGLKIGDGIKIKGSGYNPYIITEDYQLKDKNGYARYTLMGLIQEDFRKITRIKEQIHEELKRMARNWKPDWEDFSQHKYYITYSFASDIVHERFDTVSKHANTIYFKSMEEARKAIDSFTEEEWKRYFEVENERD